MQNENVVRVVFQAAMNGFRNDVNNELNNLHSAFTSFAKSIPVLIGVAIAKKAVDVIKQFSDKAIEEYGKTQTAMGEISSLGVNDVEAVRKAAIDFSNTWSGTTREQFISASYDIKSGISSLTDEGVAKFTEMAALTGKATKSTVQEMTNLFAKGYGIYRNQFNSDDEFAEKFSAGISKSVEQFRTQGSEMSSFISALGASAEKAGRPLAEVLAIGGQLQTTMTGSEAATRLNAFLRSAVKAGQELGLSFIDANNNLKSIPDIINTIKQKYGEVIDANEKAELTKAFGTDEAIAMIDLLYDKVQDVVENTKSISQEMGNGSEATEKMAQSMNEGIAEKSQILKQRINNIFEGFGEKIAPYVNETFNKLFEKLDAAQQDGSIEQIGESFKDLMKVVFSLFNSIIEYLPQIIKVGAFVFDYIGYKIKSLIIIFDAVKVVFLFFVKMLLGGFNSIVKAIDGLLSIIPGIGKQFESVSNSIKNTMNGIDNEIRKTAINMANLMGLNKELQKETTGKSENPVMFAANKIIEMSQQKKQSTSKTFETSAASPVSQKKSGKSSGSSTKTDNRTIFEKKVDEIDDNFEPKEELINSQIDLAKAEKDDNDRKTFQQAMIDTLKAKLLAYVGLEGYTKGDEKLVLETMQNKILTKIANLIDNIKGDLSELVSGFNAPSEISPLTQYAYETMNNNSNLITTASNKTFNVTFQINDTSNKTATEAAKKLHQFANKFEAELDLKDSIVKRGLQDIIRNM